MSIPSLFINWGGDKVEKFETNYSQKPHLMKPNKWSWIEENTRLRIPTFPFSINYVFKRFYGFFFSFFPTNSFTY